MRPVTAAAGRCSFREYIWSQSKQPWSVFYRLAAQERTCTISPACAACPREAQRRQVSRRLRGWRAARVKRF